MKGLQAGDPAMICGCTNDDLNGMVVRLVAHIGDVVGAKVSAGGHTWSISRKSTNRFDLWHVTAEHGAATDLKGNRFKDFPCPAKYLMPLRGEPEPASQQQRELAHD